MIWTCDGIILDAKLCDGYEFMTVSLAAMSKSYNDANTSLFGSLPLRVDLKGTTV